MAWLSPHKRTPSLYRVYHEEGLSRNTSPVSIGNTSSIRARFPASYVSLPEGTLPQINKKMASQNRQFFSKGNEFVFQAFIFGSQIWSYMFGFREKTPVPPPLQNRMGRYGKCKTNRWFSKNRFRMLSWGHRADFYVLLSNKGRQIAQDKHKLLLKKLQKKTHHPIPFYEILLP